MGVVDKECFHLMTRIPASIPPEPGVFALLNNRRRFVYVAYTRNLQKRSHSMSHMLMNYDKDRAAYWPIRELPKHPSGEFVFVILRKGVTPERSLAAIAVAQRTFLAKKYAIVRGHRAGTPSVRLNGRTQTLAEAVRDRPKLKYPTVYRRLQRGWSVRQALGLDPPDPRWDHELQEKRRKRAA